LALKRRWPILGAARTAILQPQPDWPKTLDEFRAWHERQPEVWEFIHCVPKLMVPGSMAHTLIKSNAGRLLGNALEGTGCRALVDGAIVEVEGSSLIPEVVVTCSPLDFTTPRVAEPIIIVEVLSPSNQGDDTGRKLALYLKIPSLRHFLVVEQERRQIVHHERRDDLGGAFLTNVAPPDPLRLDPPSIEIALAALYEGVPLAAAG
jgi:Uma2 family endonuclease